MKKILKYSLITLLLLISLVFVGILYLFFVRGSNLFGLTYIAHNENYFTQAYEATGINTVQLDNTFYDVIIVPSKTENISAKIHFDTFGFTHVDYKDLKHTSNVANGVLSITVSEPKGALVYKNSYIELKMPTNAINLSIKNDYGTTTLNNETIKINNLSYKTKMGEFNFIKGDVLSLFDLELENGIFRMEETAKNHDVNGLNIKVASGKFYDTTHTFGSVSITNTMRGVVTIGSCRELSQTSQSAGGRISVGTVNTATISSSDTNIYISKLIGASSISLSASGKIEIDEYTSTSTLKTTYGNILIKKANAPVVAESANGNIYIKECTSYVVSSTTIYGNITVEFKSDAESYTPSTKTRSVTAKSSNGNITVKGAENVNLETTDKGNIHLELNDVSGLNTNYEITENSTTKTYNNIVKSAKGNIYVQFKDGADFILDTKSPKGSVNINYTALSDAGGITNNSEITTSINNATVSTSPTMLIASSNGGSVVIRENALANTTNN